ncbi:MAG: ankyrin repeat domain-containing protein [Alphaproteobacteria bacterium]|nr:ankyrin repeat domain-containing protein [Alphaproteobacteria bacterium]
MKKGIVVIIVLVVLLFLFYPKKISDLQYLFIENPNVKEDRIVSVNNVIGIDAPKEDGFSYKTMVFSKKNIKTKNEWESADFWRKVSFDEISEKINKGIDINKRNTVGVSLLMFAVSYCNDERVIELLLANGAKLNVRDENGRTALVFGASFNNNPLVIEKLIERGAEVDVLDKYGRTPLMYAVNYNTNPLIAKKLIEKGADVNARITKVQTPEARASLTNKMINVTKLSLKYTQKFFEELYKITFNEEQINKTIFEIAEKNIDEFTGNLLNKEENMTPLMIATRSSSSLGVIEVLLDNGADVKAYDASGKTAFDHAKDNPFIFNTNMYWKLNDMQY